MPEPEDTSTDDHGSSDQSTEKATGDGPSTPVKKSTDGGATPNSAPARPRASSKPAHPTLLSDFFLGRPSPARIAAERAERAQRAERQRRQSIDAVKAELRQEMKASAVRRVAPPGGVKDRVKAWQKANAAVVVNEGIADDAATEPTDVAFGEDDIDSVTEEDRVRIKMRQNKRPSKKHAASKSMGNIDIAEMIANEQPRPVSMSPPKKRVVSDRNWMKNRQRRSPPRKVSPKPKKSASPPSVTQNPHVADKVKEWAALVQQPPDAPKAKGHRPSKSVDVSSLSREPVGDDGIRVKPLAKKFEGADHGIRINAGPSSNEERRRERQAVRSARRRGTSVVSSRSEQTSRRRDASVVSSRSEQPSRDEIIVIEDGTELSRTELSTELSQTELSTEMSASHLDTPTRRGKSRSRPPVTRKPKSYLSGASDSQVHGTEISDEESYVSGSHLPLSDLGSNLTEKTLADIPGDIPWGHSAFTELDLPLNGPARSRPKRTKVERNTSFKGMPGVFKRVVEEGKKMMTERPEPPRTQAGNKPPSIETWLNTTVDPFVDKKSDGEASETHEASSKPAPKRRGSAQSAKRKTSNPVSNVESKLTEELTELTDITESTGVTQTTRSTEADAETAKETAKETATPETVKRKPQSSEATTPTSGGSAGLKRRSAQRTTSSPFKAAGKSAFLGMLKEAFSGESSGHTSHPKVYQSQEQRYMDLDELTELSSSLLSGTINTESDVYSELTDDKLRDPMTPAPLSLPTPRLRPPTNGHHELSTIMSENSSAIESDLSSDASHSTLTQSTGLTKESDRSRDVPSGGGLKRRLTKHSDLVSVLSLPDDGKVPSGYQAGRSRPSVRKTRGRENNVTVEELLGEFRDDEELYLRELKTLVDGVVPVLLTQVIDHGDGSDLFSNGDTTYKSSSMYQAVVAMGVALEKLKNAHKKAPLKDMRRLSYWANGVIPIYHSYLSSWRLGFQDLYINLAPKDNMDDEDSLIGALPRNDKGDIINSQGERVDVAYLLKRPLLRLKQMTKFMTCVDQIMPSYDTAQLLQEFEDLQDKARRRFREETARLADEEAAGTDTTRCRDIRTLGAIDGVTIDSTRQVSAKDMFSLYLEHSNGQRMECQVELVHRDRPSHPEDAGDLLIRETGDSRRSYLLFPPMHMSQLSARTGDGNFDMVVMIRGADADRPWHELLTLTADDEDQILDWLDILPVSPYPPRQPEPSVVGDPDEDEYGATDRLPNAPVGARGFRTPSGGMQRRESRRATRSPLAATPTKRQPSFTYGIPEELPTTPKRREREPENITDNTPTQDSYNQDREDEATTPLRESMRPDPRSFSKAAGHPYYRDDGAPPPPVHRSLSPAPILSPKGQVSNTPTEDRKDNRVKRRTSSPLKHEYTPSAQSASDVSASEEEDIESSDDEIESLDLPETELGVSLQKPVAPALAPPNVTASECSLTPSNSASQAGLHGPKLAEDNASRFIAAVSHWSHKGLWRDLRSEACQIVVSAGLIEVYTYSKSPKNSRPATAEGDIKPEPNHDVPLLALDLTPLVLCRQSTTVDLEIRSSVQPHCRLAKTYQGGNFRFRCSTGPDCYNLYMSVHNARLNNQKFIELEQQARFKSFGERRAPRNGDDDTSSRRKSWFGRKNSYRGSVRAPSQSFDGASQTPTTSSASSFLKRLTAAGNMSFNIARSSVDRHHRPGSGQNSLYSSEPSSGSGTPPRSPSISVGADGLPRNLGSDDLRIRLHLLAIGNKWEDMGNCTLTVSRPPPGWRQALRANHGMEKRITVSTLPRKETDKPAVKLDAVLGSGCFQPLGTKGIVCGVWEEMKGEDGVAGVAPAQGATGGNVQRWCFQFGTAGEAQWVLRLVHQEVYS